MKKTNSTKLLLSVIICELAGAVGSIFTSPAINSWYKGLNKPSFNPPAWIFGPVWAIIFLLMGISLYLVWSKKWVVHNKISKSKTKSWNSWSQKFYDGKWQTANIVMIFAFQLILNVLWSIIFFGLHSPAVALCELLMLFFAVVFTIINFYRVSKNAAWLLLPYIFWLLFAMILNYFIVILN